MPNVCLVTGLLMCVGSGAAIERPVIKAQASVRCGVAPLPPVGCKVGPCMCDASGFACQWTFICN